jgi:hypothetical protein
VEIWPECRLDGQVLPYDDRWTADVAQWRAVDRSSPIDDC